MAEKYLMHYGVARRSGRYPWGSGDRPYQSGGGPAIAKKRRKAGSGPDGSTSPKPASEMTTQEMKKYNEDRKQKEKYENYLKKDARKGLDKAITVSRDADQAVSNVKKVVNDAYNDQHKQEKASIDLSNVSDEDLRKIVARMNLEQQYRNLTPTEVKKGEKAVKMSLETLGALTAITASTLGIVSHLKDLGLIGGKAGGVSERQLTKYKNGGSYEKRSAKKYEEADSKYKDAKNLYKSAKALRKDPNVNIDKNVIRSAKYQMKGAKQNRSRAEKELRTARAAQKGRDLYNRGVTISDIRQRQRNVALVNLGTNLGVNYLLNEIGASPVARVAVNTATNAVSITNMAISAIQKKQLRAYYSR